VSAPLDPHNRLIVDELRRALGDVVAVYRFGSSAEGTAHRRSDTDIAVLTRNRLSATARFDLQERLAGLIGTDIDLVDLSGASPVLAIQVVARGELLHDGDPATRGKYEDLVFSAYARLNEERRGILDRVTSEGTVYGR
jgi:predicted nucleotidyltransferase